MTFRNDRPEQKNDDTDGHLDEPVPADHPTGQIRARPVGRLPVLLAQFQRLKQPVDRHRLELKLVQVLKKDEHKQDKRPDKSADGLIDPIGQLQRTRTSHGIAVCVLPGAASP